MTKFGRRTLLAGLGVLGLGAVGYGGSLGGCAIRSSRQALLESLFVARHDILAPRELGRAWLEREAAPDAASALLGQPGLTGALLAPDPGTRRGRIRTVVAEEFAAGDVVIAGGWVVARTEARLAGVWVAYG